MSHSIITRFAPSPTGVLHIGGARTALFNYLFARQNKGKLILRVEDTDRERSKKEYEDDIINGLKWLGLEWDEFYKQSERTEIYKKYLQKLLDEDKAYSEGQAVRFRNHNKIVPFNDLIRGEIKFDTTELGDFVIAKNLETPLFHFAGAVDDFEMKVTHIIRGEDHISNTPRQILIQEALGFSRPIYAHIPLILGPDRSKLSKRHGATSLDEYKELGYLPEALVNFIAFLGWNPGDEKEIFSKEELIKEFSLKKIQKGGAIFNIAKLEWFNKKYLEKTDVTLEAGVIKIDAPILKLLIKDKRISKLSDIKALKERGELDYFYNQPEYESELLIWKDSDKEKTKLYLAEIAKILCDTPEERIQEKIWKYAEEKGKGDVLWPFRVALTGLEKSPDPFSVAGVLGKDKVLERIKHAIEKL